MTKHQSYCFAGQPALCPNYFVNDTLPCVCGVSGNVLSALNQIAPPATLGPPAAPEIHLLPLSA